MGVVGCGSYGLWELWTVGIVVSCEGCRGLWELWAVWVIDYGGCCGLRGLLWAIGIVGCGSYGCEGCPGLWVCCRRQGLWAMGTVDGSRSVTKLVLHGVEWGDSCFPSRPLHPCSLGPVSPRPPPPFLFPSPSPPFPPCHLLTTTQKFFRTAASCDGPRPLCSPTRRIPNSHFASHFDHTGPLG